MRFLKPGSTEVKRFASSGGKARWRGVSAKKRREWALHMRATMAGKKLAMHAPEHLVKWRFGSKTRQALEAEKRRTQALIGTSFRTPL